MAQWDGGAYGDVVLNGDVHTENQNAAGLPTRNNAKTFIYAFLYGAGDEKIGSIVGKGRAAGKALKEKFLTGLPALGKLKNAVEKACKRGYLIGLDGRRVPVRSAHSALNTLLQGAGALISKRWLIECFLEAEARGLRYGWDGDFTLLGYVHDELQWAVREGLEKEFGEMAVLCAKRAGDYFKFKCPIDAEFKIGDSWFDCH
jgi:DNA polymerase I-like protein with 3'-5' exonuclease and polymerase domains